MSASISHVPLLYCYQWFLFIPVTNRLHRQRLRRERVQATLPETQPRIGVNLVVSVSISLLRLYSRFGSMCMIVHHASSRFVSFNWSMCWSCFQVMCFMFHGFQLCSIIHFSCSWFIMIETVCWYFVWMFLSEIMFSSAFKTIMLWSCFSAGYGLFLYVLWLCCFYNVF